MSEPRWLCNALAGTKRKPLCRSAPVTVHPERLPSWDTEGHSVLRRTQPPPAGTCLRHRPPRGAPQGAAQSRGSFSSQPAWAPLPPLSAPGSAAPSSACCGQSLPPSPGKPGSPPAPSSGSARSVPRHGALRGLWLLRRHQRRLPALVPALLGAEPRAARALHGRGLPRPAGAGLLRGPLPAVGPHDHYTAWLILDVCWSSETCSLALWMVWKCSVLYRNAPIY